MRHLEIKTNKRLLIVEYHNDKSFQDDLSFYRQFKIGGFEQYFVKIICSGSQLTEDIARGLVHQSLHTGLFAHYVKGIPVNAYCYKTALEAFDAVIYAYGYHWGENPEPSHYDYQNDDCETDFAQYYLEHEKWQEAESRTFRPEKTLIFEIL